MNRRRLAILVAGFALVAPPIWVPTPAHASIDSCTGTGTMNVDSGFGMPLSAPTSATFSINMNVVCLSFSTSVTMSGFLNGWCGLMSGYGTANVFGTHPAPYEHRFVINGGPLSFFAGEVAGDATTLEDPLDAGSCLTGSATRFIVTGTVTFNHHGCVVQPFGGPGYTVYSCATPRALVP